MRGWRSSALWTYLFAVAAVALATAARISIIDPMLGGRIPFPAYFVAVIGAVWVGGAGPGLLAAALGYGAALGLFWAGHREASGPFHVVGTLLYVLVCASAIALAERLRRAQARAEALAAEAQRAQAALIEADRRKDEFLATLAHELRNPLTPIRSGLDLIGQKGASPGLIEKRCRMMARQLGHLVRLVDDLTEVSYFTRGKIGLRKRWVELESLVADAVETSRSNIEETGTNLTVDLPRQAVWLHVDPTRLAQILANLLNNSAKFTPPGGRIELQAALESAGSAGEGRVVLSVRDSGCGIPAEILPTIFDLFVQGPSSTDRRLPGLGIGLHLVRRLVDLHGGTVEARSAGVGRGSEFVVRLPTGSERTAGPPGPERAPKSSGPARGPRRLLVVDDNRDVADGLAEVLKLFGHEVRVAHDGPSALAIEASFEPDLVLLDIGLPGMDGYEVARRLRDRPERRPVLVAVTGWGEDKDRLDARDAGFDVHMPKPLDIPALEQLLDSGPTAELR